MKIVLFGAGSAQFGYGMLGDIFQNRTLQDSEVVLVDIKPDALQVVEDAAHRYIQKHNHPAKVWATTDAEKALPGADFVIISIEVGDRFELWEQDWHIPLQYGFRQIYGENGGAGGVFHALRIIPPILRICSQVEQLCPDAYVFCYSNPLTAIATTVMRKFPEMKFIGVCHEIASLERYLPDILQTPIDNLHVRAAGLNHFSVIVEAKYLANGKDAYPDLIDRAKEFFASEPGYSEIWEYVQKTGELPRTEGERKRMDLSFIEARSWSDRRLFKKFIDWFGLVPITVDSHMGEYVPWAFELADHRGIRDFYTLYKYALSRVEPVIEEESVHERAGLMMEGIITDSGYEEPAVNIPNKGLIPGLPEFISVEVPAKVGKDGFTGIPFPDYPKAFGALLRNYAGVNDMVAEAVIHKKKEYAFQALLVNPLITDARKAWELLETMIDRQKQWLGYLS